MWRKEPARQDGAAPKEQRHRIRFYLPVNFAFMSWSSQIHLVKMKELS